MPRSAEGATDRETQVSDATIKSLKSMTDDVLKKYTDPKVFKPPIGVVQYTISNPHIADYKLVVYAIDEGIEGLNTGSALPQPDSDISKRWTIHIDRGNRSVGSGYDDKGTIYEHGGFQINDTLEQNLDTGPIDTLISQFACTPESSVDIEIWREDFSAFQLGPFDLQTAP